jgi:ligand-binding SRPBCC domain-containing protein
LQRYILQRSQLIPRPREEVFPFFADARNLERITPGFISFSVATTGDIAMGDGTIIEYRLRLYGIPQGWRTRIVEWRPPEGFADLQEKGPYHYWLHKHSFEARQGETLMHDRVEYELPFGPLGRLVHWLLVRRTLAAIFDYRTVTIERLLAR